MWKISWRCWIACSATELVVPLERAAARDIQAPQLLLRQLETYGAELVLQLGHAVRTHDRRSDCGLGQEPGQGDLGRRSCTRQRDLSDEVKGLPGAVIIAVTAVDALGPRAPGWVLSPSILSGEEAATQRAVRNHA